MLVLKKLEIEGFGPFADRQTIDFPDGPGVVVVYGENMRGKSSLLNAIRYAFFGEALARGSRQRKLHELSNRELASQGKYGFSVRLTFAFDGNDYELVRQCDSKDLSPTTDSDYSETLMVRSEAGVMGPQAAEHLLSAAFPHQISRFFLFDGELLQEYEELLINESETGRSISLAIEKILGVPILKSGRTHLEYLTEQAQKGAATEAQKEARTEELGNKLAQAVKLRSAHQDEIDRLQETLVGLRKSKQDLDSYFASSQKYSSLLEQRDKSEDRRKAAQVAEVEANAALKKVMADAWRTALRDRVRSTKQDVFSKVATAFDEYGLALRARAIEAQHCETCDQDVDESQAAQLAATVPAAVSSDTTREKLGAALSRLRDLERFDDVDNTAQVEAVWSALTNAQLEQIRCRDEIAEINVELGEADLDQVRKSKFDRDLVFRQIIEAEDGLERERKRKAESSVAVDKLSAQLKATGTADLLQLQQKAGLLAAASEVLAEAVERYKDQLRAQVEASASELFLSMTTEHSDYAGLSINEAYGLSIMHKDGHPEEARSAGAEHVVALALMGALQRNAPLRGPIVMDSPFGRLDERHTANVIETLPKMADQVVLLVFEAEVGVDRMRRLLGSDLRREYRLDRISARRTNIVEWKS